MAAFSFLRGGEFHTVYEVYRDVLLTRGSFFDNLPQIKVYILGSNSSQTPRQG